MSLNKNDCLNILILIIVVSAPFILFEMGINRGDKESETKVFVINLVGGDWQAVNRFNHSLENLMDIKRNGIHGVSICEQSLTMSPIETTVLSTGVDPDKNKLIDYAGEEGEYMHGSGRIVNSKDIQYKTIWEIADQAGYRVGVYNWLMSWPVKKVDGFMIGGRIGKRHGGTIAYPRSLEKEIEAGNTRILKGDLNEILDRYEDVNLWMLQFERVHENSHRYWISLYPGKYGLENDTLIKKYREKLLNSYTEVDEMIGMTREKFPEANIIVIADIGMREIDFWKGHTSDIFEKLNTNITMMDWDLEFPPGFKEKAKSTGMLGEIGPWVSLKVTKNMNRDLIKDQLSEVTVEDTDERFITNISFRNDTLWFKFNFKRKWVNGVTDRLNLSLPNNQSLNMFVKRMTGGHAPRSILLASGPDIDNSDKFIRVHNRDIVPNVLDILNVQKPNYMDSSVSFCKDNA